MNKHNQSGSINLAIIGVFVLIIVAGVSYVLWSNFIANKSSGQSASDMASEKNLKLITDARYHKNPTLCEKISGGIKAQKGASLSTYEGAIDYFGNKALSESEARAQCKKLVNDVLSQ
jgi:hypothetical protein